MAITPRNSGFQGAAARPAPATPPEGKTDDWMTTGEAGRAQSAAVQARNAEKRAAGFTPFRLHLKPNTQADVIVLDADIGPFLFEHSLTFEPAFARNNRHGKPDSINELCCHQTEPCPICRHIGKEAYYAFFLTVIDTRPVTSNGKSYPYTRKIMAVKADQHSKFMRLFDRIKAERGTIRGTHLLLSRDGQRSSVIGDPDVVSVLSEQQISEYFGHAAVLDQSGKVIKEANADLKAVEYKKIFKRPSAADILSRYPFLTATPGSAAAGGGAVGVAAGFRPAAGAAAPGGASGGGFQRAAGTSATAPADDSLEEDGIPY